LVSISAAQVFASTAPAYAISRITNIYPPKNNTRYVEQYSIAVVDTNGNPPCVNEPSWAIRNNMPVLFSGNQLVNSGNST
jgi:hypothetical protein